jgi:2'-5' RNA ligase
MKPEVILDTAYFPDKIGKSDLTDQIDNILKAANEVYDGAMLAIMLPSTLTKRMRKITSDDLYDSLHLTLLYLGKASALDKDKLEAIRKTVEKVCARHAPLRMSITGAGIFKPGDDGTPVFVIPNAKGLSALQAELETAVGNLIDLPSEHGWVPHMTVYYSNDKPELPDLDGKLEWIADKIRLQAGGKKVADIRLGSGKKASDDQKIRNYGDILIQAADILDAAGHADFADGLVPDKMCDDTLIQAADALDTLGRYDLADALDGIVRAAAPEKPSFRFPDPQDVGDLQEGSVVKIRHWDDSVEFATIIMLRKDKDLAVIQYLDGETLTSSLSALTHEIEEILPTN